MSKQTNINLKFDGIFFAIDPLRKQFSSFLFSCADIYRRYQQYIYQKQFHGRIELKQKSKVDESKYALFMKHDALWKAPKPLPLPPWVLKSHTKYQMTSK